jgi:hypothetical protein
MREFNGVCLIGDCIWSTPDDEFATDACLTGCGGFNGSQFFMSAFPEHILEAKLHISALEIFTVLLAVRLWCLQYTGRRIRILCDNLASVMVLNAGKSKDPFMLKCVHEICFLCATHNFEIKAQHIPGVDNRIPDYLSRVHLNGSYLRKFKELTSNLDISEVQIPHEYFYIIDSW